MVFPEKREGNREGGRGERVLSLSFECKNTDPANSPMNRSYLLFSSISRLYKHKKSYRTEDKTLKLTTDQAPLGHPSPE